MKFYILLSINFLLFIQFSISQQKNEEADSITVTGTTSNAKAGAVVQTKKGGLYYVDGISSWNDNVLNKTVEVKGFLKKATFKQEDLKNEKGEWMQGMIGEKLTIVKPVWKIVKN